MKRSNVRLFVALFAVGMLEAAAVIPYVFTTIGISEESAGVSLPTLIGYQLLQSAVLLGVSIFIGLLLFKRVHLTMPYIEALVEGKKLRRHPLLTTAVGAVATGIGVCIVVVLLDFVLFGTRITTSLSLSMVSPLWQRLLASFYGGVFEELVMRFFLLTGLAWLLMKAGGRRSSNVPTDLAMWCSIVLTAAIFGVGQLPFASSFVPLSATIVFRALLLNGVSGIVFGWLYWKRGLESAMIAHIASDVMLLVFLPLGIALFVH